MHYLDKRYPVHGSSWIFLWIFNRLSTPVFYNALWKTKQGNLRTILSVQYREEKDFGYHVRPLVKGPARGGGTELLKKGRLLLLLSKAFQCWNASKWEVHWTMLSNKLQDVFPFALIKLGIVTNKSPDWTLKQAFLENVQFGIRFLLSREMSFNIFFWNLVVIVNQDCFRIILFFCIWCFVLCWGLTFCWLVALGWQNIKLWL